MRNYIISYSFAHNDKTVSGEISVLAGDINEAKHTAANRLQKEYGIYISWQSLKWEKVKPFANN